MRDEHMVREIPGFIARSCFSDNIEYYPDVPL